MFRSTLTLAALCLLTGCASSMPPLSVDKSLVIQNCPPLAPLADGSLGAVVLKLSEVAGQYHRCRSAALGK